MKVMKRTQIELLEVKTTMYKIKYTEYVGKDRLVITEEKISKHITIEHI